jgi:4-hydroxyphenylpyruvate dioxygenase
MSYEDMLSWSLFHTTLFDMGKSAMVDVVDPDGLVRSQALETPDGRVRVTLNGAETHKTMAGSFLEDSFHASVQHIAFATDDIFQTAKSLDTHGFSSLPIPANYYADLAARFDIGSDRLAQLRMGNILYDEDAQGKFFQLYSRPFAGGMFFEIIQRTDGYGGYGGPNAPFRIAAQKRLMRQKGMPKM